MYGDFFAIVSVIEHVPVDVVLMREPESKQLPFADHVFLPAEFVEAIADVLMFDDGVKDDTFHVTEGVFNAVTDWAESEEEVTQANRETIKETVEIRIHELFFNSAPCVLHAE